MNNSVKSQLKNKQSGINNHFHSSAQSSNPLQKEFQLLYRTRDHLPSQQAYQSLIFMKSKKCPQSNRSLNPKKSPDTQLRIMIKNLEKKIKTHQQQQSKKAFTQKNKVIHSCPIIEERDSLVTAQRKKLKKSKSPIKNQNRSRRDIESSRKQTSKVKISIPTHKDYILIGQDFISLSQGSISELEEKIHQFYNYHHSKITKSTEEDIVLKNDCKKSQAQVEAYQQYLNSKAKKIQRWWRRLKNNKNKINPHIVQPIANININTVTPSTTYDKQNTIPPQNIPLQSLSNSHHAIQLRENAARIQFNTHKAILDKLLSAKKIQINTYVLKINQIEDNLANQLSQIEQIKQILKKNAEKVEKMVKKAKQDIILSQKNEQLTQQVLNKLFQAEECYQGRKKSAGCHYNPTSVRHFFSREIPDHFLGDSDEEETNRIPQSQNSDYYAQNPLVSNGFMGNPNFQILIDEYKERQLVRNEIDKRLAIQMGVISAQFDNHVTNKQKINTSISGIHNFLDKFLKFYIEYYKDQFLRYINMPYGYSPRRRLAYMQSYDEYISSNDDEDDEGILYGIQNVIGEQILDQFYQEQFSQQQLGSSSQLFSNEFEKIHSRVVFDAFNEALNYFRPYYIINGPPYIWNNCQKSLTFYFITQDNIRQVFEKTQFKVLKWSSALCGIIMNQYDRNIQNNEHRTLDDVISRYKECTHPVVVQNREEKLFKSQKLEVQQFNYGWFLYEEQKTALLYEISTLILENLASQLQQQIFSIKKIDMETSFFGQSLELGV